MRILQVRLNGEQVQKTQNSFNRSFRYGDISESHGVVQISKKKIGRKQKTEIHIPCP